MPNLPKIVVILGPTASGKTDLGIALAKQFNGEIVSVDSRQVYTKMNIGTMKPKGKWVKTERGRVYTVAEVPHYGLDIADPGSEITVAEFKILATQAMYDILERGKRPFLVGGTGLYIWSIIDNLDAPSVAPNKKLRHSLEKKSLDKLTRLLKKIDPEAYSLVDLKNPRRVIRALEVAILTGESFALKRKKLPPLFEVLQIGIRHDTAALYDRIDRRVDTIIAGGLIKEVKALIKQKYGWQLSSMSSIGYKQVGYYLQGECTLTEAVEFIKRETRHYAKRQMTWFKRDERIQWVQGGDIGQARELVQKFLSDHN